MGLTGGINANRADSPPPPPKLRRWQESKQRLLHYAEEHVMNDDNSITFFLTRPFHGWILKFSLIQSNRLF